MKAIIIVLCIYFSCVIAGCSVSGANPLLKMSEYHAAKLLFEADQKAEKQLHLSYGGYAYSHCMDAELRKPLCQQVYKQMLRYMHNQVPQRLTLADITDPVIWRGLRGTYKAMVFDQ